MSKVVWEHLSTYWNWVQEPKRISLLVKKFVNWTKFPYSCKWSFKLMYQGLTLAFLYSCQYLISNYSTPSVVRAEWCILSPDWSTLRRQTAESHLKGILWVVLLFILVLPPMMVRPTLCWVKEHNSAVQRCYLPPGSWALNFGIQKLVGKCSCHSSDT